MKSIIEMVAQRWDHWLAGVALVTLVAVAAVSGAHVRRAQNAYQTAVSRLANGDVAVLEPSRGDERYNIRTLGEVRNQIHPDRLQTERDIFNPVVAAREAAPAAAAPMPTPPAFELLDITLRPLALQYCGYVVLPEGVLAAQVNYDQKSYLVRRGMRIAHYVVTAVDTERLVLQRNGELIRLPFRGIAYSEERLAWIREPDASQIRYLIKGETIAGFTVSEVTDDLVELSNTVTTITLQKGKVEQ